MLVVVVVVVTCHCRVSKQTKHTLEVCVCFVSSSDLQPKH